MKIRVTSGSGKRRSGFTITELLSTIATLGLIASFAFQSISKIYDAAKDANARSNARNLESMSAQLSSIGVGHVIPDSYGGIEATVKLFRAGIIVPEGPMSGNIFVLKGISDSDIPRIAKLLQVYPGKGELRLRFSGD